MVYIYIYIHRIEVNGRMEDHYVSKAALMMRAKANSYVPYKCTVFLKNMWKFLGFGYISFQCCIFIFRILSYPVELQVCSDASHPSILIIVNFICFELVTKKSNSNNKARTIYVRGIVVVVGGVMR